MIVTNRLSLKSARRVVEEIRSEYLREMQRSACLGMKPNHSQRRRPFKSLLLIFQDKPFLWWTSIVVGYLRMCIMRERISRREQKNNRNQEMRMEKKYDLLALLLHARHLWLLSCVNSELDGGLSFRVLHQWRFRSMIKMTLIPAQKPACKPAARIAPSPWYIHDRCRRTISHACR